MKQNTAIDTSYNNEDYSVEDEFPSTFFDQQTEQCEEQWKPPDSERGELHYNSPLKKNPIEASIAPRLIMSSQQKPKTYVYDHNDYSENPLLRLSDSDSMKLLIQSSSVLRDFNFSQSPLSHSVTPHLGGAQHQFQQNLNNSTEIVVYDALRDSMQQASLYFKEIEAGQVHMTFAGSKKHHFHEKHERQQSDLTSSSHLYHQRLLAPPRESQLARSSNNSILFPKTTSTKRDRKSKSISSLSSSLIMNNNRHSQNNNFESMLKYFKDQALETKNMREILLYQQEQRRQDSICLQNNRKKFKELLLTKQSSGSMLPTTPSFKGSTNLSRQSSLNNLFHKRSKSIGSQASNIPKITLNLPKPLPPERIGQKYFDNLSHLLQSQLSLNFDNILSVKNDLLSKLQISNQSLSQAKQALFTQQTLQQTLIHPELMLAYQKQETLQYSEQGLQIEIERINQIKEDKAKEYNQELDQLEIWLLDLKLQYERIDYQQSEERVQEQAMLELQSQQIKDLEIKLWGSMQELRQISLRVKEADDDQQRALKFVQLSSQVVGGAGGGPSPVKQMRESPKARECQISSFQNSPRHSRKSSMGQQQQGKNKVNSFLL